MLFVQAILSNGEVALECLVELPEEAKEMRRHMLAVKGVAEVRILDQAEWVKL
jgi:hypothetical protein